MSRDISVDIKVTSNANLARREFEEAIDRALWAIGATAEKYAKEICPVDTGRLRNSITHVSTGDSAIIGTSTEYASFVEFGTSRHPTPQPFIRPAATQHSSEYKRIVQASLEAG